MKDHLKKYVMIGFLFNSLVCIAMQPAWQTDGWSSKQEKKDWKSAIGKWARTYDSLTNDEQRNVRRELATAYSKLINNKFAYEDGIEKTESAFKQCLETVNKLPVNKTIFDSVNQDLEQLNFDKALVKLRIVTAAIRK